MVAFEEKIERVGDRYQVGLPWKEGRRDRLVPNKASALKRLQSLQDRLKKDPEMEDRYHRVIAEMWEEGIIY